MPSIDSVQQIVTAIRTEMASGLARSTKRVARPKLGAQQSSRMVELINRRIAALAPADPQRGRKAFRIFLESVLLEEFGEGLINDPAFYAMIDSVQSQMENDGGLDSAMKTAISTLLNENANAA